jgi:hypothetical protein
VKSQSAWLTQFKIGWEVVRASVKTMKFSNSRAGDSGCSPILASIHVKIAQASAMRDW